MLTLILSSVPGNTAQVVNITVEGLSGNRGWVGGQPLWPNLGLSAGTGFHLLGARGLGVLSRSLKVPLASG